MRALIAVLLVLTACGQQGIAEEIPPPSTIEQRDTDWFTSIDPATGRDFRCTLWAIERNSGSGLASWCYEPVEGELP
jgi:ABC-type transport system substrate-binding protein